MEKKEGRAACVTGGSGYLGSMLVKHLLQNGYSVNTTTTDPDNVKKVSHLLELQKQYSSGELKIFRADMKVEGSFDEAIAGCDIVFHVATPVNFASADPENDMIKPAVQGTLDILKACTKAKTVKRVIYTSSAAAVMGNKQIKDTNGLVFDEGFWTDIEFLTSEKPSNWGYAVSKTLAEQAALRYAEENNIDVITVIPPLVVGPAIISDVPNSVNWAMSFVTGNDDLINDMKHMQMQCGTIPLTHVEDVIRAHVFLAEKESASGRYICCAINSSVVELANPLSKRYPQYNIATDFGEFPRKAKSIISSEKLIKEGFSFKYGINEIYDHTIEYFKEVGVLHK